MSLIDRLLGKKAEAPTAPAPRPQRPEWEDAELRLPSWAKVASERPDGASIKIEVDMQQAYPYWLQLLGFDELTQYNLEVAYQCIKLDLQAALVRTAYDPRVAGKHAVFKFLRAEEYAQAGKPVGRSAETVTAGNQKVTLAGAELASQGLHARQHYVRIRGALPL